MSHFCQEQKKNSVYSKWVGGMEHIGITEKHIDIQSAINYILAFQNQPLLAKNFLSIDKKLLTESENITTAILKNLGNTIKDYGNNSDIASVYDFSFIFYPQRVEAISKISKVLDFGAGYGRQANLFTKTASQYWATDAIESSYMTQKIYLSELSKLKNIDYYNSLDVPIEYNEIKDKKGIFHLPSWELPTLDKEYFDIIIFSHILPELPEETFEKVFPMLMDLIRPDGFLYIRDHGIWWQPGHLYDVDKILTENGFILEYSLYARDKNDIHGIPRIYRKLSKDITHKVTRKIIKSYESKN